MPVLVLAASLAVACHGDKHAPPRASAPTDATAPSTADCTKSWSEIADWYRELAKQPVGTADGLTG
jgi:hypothetical protein